MNPNADWGIVNIRDRNAPGMWRPMGRIYGSLADAAITALWTPTSGYLTTTTNTSQPSRSLGM